MHTPPAPPANHSKNVSLCLQKGGKSLCLLLLFFLTGGGGNNLIYLLHLWETVVETLLLKVADVFTGSC